MNLPLIIIAGILAVWVIVFLVYKTVTDEQQFEIDDNTAKLSFNYNKLS
jgi:hypothetical protein